MREAKDGNAMALAAERKGAPLHMDRWMAGQDGALHVPAEASGLRCGYPEGESGTTEFGHVLFDAGRKVRGTAVCVTGGTSRHCAHAWVCGDHVRCIRT